MVFFEVTFLSNAIITHPARNSWAAIFKKENRIAIESAIFKKLKLMKFNPVLSAIHLVLIFLQEPYPSNNNWNYQPSVKEKIQLSLMRIYFYFRRWWTICFSNPIKK